MLTNHLFSIKKVPEAVEPVGPIEVCCDDTLFGVWEEECRTPVRKAAHRFERENWILYRCQVS
jgi:hypothetical protein